MCCCPLGVAPCSRPICEGLDLSSLAFSLLALHSGFPLGVRLRGANECEPFGSRSHSLWELKDCLF